MAKADAILSIIEEAIEEVDSHKEKLTERLRNLQMEVLKVEQSLGRNMADKDQLMALRRDAEDFEYSW